MKYLIIVLMVALFSTVSFAEYLTHSASEEEIVETANTKAYPGGFDEDELSVQKDTHNAKQHVTAATLQWRAEQTLKRDTAASKTGE